MCHTPCTFDADRSRGDLVKNARSCYGFVVGKAYTNSVYGDYILLRGMAESLAAGFAEHCVRLQSSQAWLKTGNCRPQDRMLDLTMDEADAEALRRLLIIRVCCPVSLEPASLEAATRCQQRFRG